MTEVNLDTLKANRVISQATKKVKIFGICELSQPMTIAGINVTKGARKSIEKAEDDTKQAWNDLDTYQVNDKDIVVGITASGTTPYVVGGLKEAQKKR